VADTAATDARGTVRSYAGHIRLTAWQAVIHRSVRANVMPACSGRMILGLGSLPW
jgi:hypothetical protein